LFENLNVNKFIINYAYTYAKTEGYTYNCCFFCIICTSSDIYKKGKCSNG
jgi:hypothetical protein